MLQRSILEGQWTKEMVTHLLLSMARLHHVVLHARWVFRFAELNSSWLVYTVVYTARKEYIHLKLFRFKELKAHDRTSIVSGCERAAIPRDQRCQKIRPLHGRQSFYFFVKIFTDIGDKLKQRARRLWSWGIYFPEKKVFSFRRNTKDFPSEIKWEKKRDQNLSYRAFSPLNMFIGYWVVGDLHNIRIFLSLPFVAGNPGGHQVAHNCGLSRKADDVA